MFPHSAPCVSQAAPPSAAHLQAYQERAPEAMFNLGFMHEFGAGVPKDLQLARRFYNMALHTTKVSQCSHRPLHY